MACSSPRHARSNLHPAFAGQTARAPPARDLPLGWPCLDPLEIDLVAAGLLERVRGDAGHETLRVTDTGMRWMAQALARNRAALSAHEALVERVATEMCRAGRLAWRGLSLRAQVATGVADKPLRWCIAKPDVFSIRHTSVESYVEPIVHEVKVRRSDLLGDLRLAAKRAAYLDLGECWYVLGCDARGKPIGEPDERAPVFRSVSGWRSRRQRRWAASTRKRRGCWATAS